MNIALFTETYFPHVNGVVTHVKTLHDGLIKAGHNVLIVTADTKTLRHYVSDNILSCPAKEFKKFYDYGVASPLSLKRLKIIKNFKPDIIHIHQEFGVGLSGVAIAKILKIPLVYTLHTMYDDYLYYVAPKPLIPVAKKMSHRYFKFLGKEANAIVGPSIKVQDFLEQCGVSKQVNIVPNALELDLFDYSQISPEAIASKKQELNFKDDETILCFCGRLGKEKSIDILLENLAQKLDRNDKIKLLILGNGPCKEELESLTAKLNLDDIVTFTGKVDHSQVPLYYACSNIFVTASVSEVNSISMLEAMAMGLPILHKYDPLNESQVIGGINGYTFYDADDMYHHIKNYVNKSDEEKTIIRHTVMETVKKSGQDNLAKYLIDVYTQLETNNTNKKKKPSVFELSYLFHKK